MRNTLGVILLFFVFLTFSLPLEALSSRFRCMWREDPATSMVIAWDQISGNNPVLFFDEVDRGRNSNAYSRSMKPSLVIEIKGMNNHFVRLRSLKPNTVYYFIVKDSQGVSDLMSFKTAPDNPDERLSIIAGGDSRNHRSARLEANMLVSKLRPHFIMFGGDMTADDTSTQWMQWFDDWQATIGSDGRLFPVVVARGNHEATNESLRYLFDVPSKDMYYAMSFAGDLLRVYTLNSLIPSGGNQKDWLNYDLEKSTAATWKFAQYHHTIRPHTQSKPERDELLLDWATLFHKYGVDLAVESDAHLVKWTWPIRPSLEPGSDMNFIRDDETGTVYIGEGGWGAPLRENNDEKSWTRNSGSFNQFKWIFVDKFKVEVRTVRTEGALQVSEVNPEEPFEPPYGLNTWKPSNGEVVTIPNRSLSREEVARGSGKAVVFIDAVKESRDIKLQWRTDGEHKGLIFEVQRAANAKSDFKTIGTIDGKGVGVNDYVFVDKGYANGVRPLITVIYRIKAKRRNGSFKYFKTKISPPGQPKDRFANIPALEIDPSGLIYLDYTLNQVADVEILMLALPQLKEISKAALPSQAVGPYSKSLDVSRISPGRYLVAIKANGQVLKRFRLIK